MKIDETSGRRAEKIAAAYITKRGYTIHQTNWRNRFCEIDIIAAKGSVLTFVEVKYRRSAEYGDGLTYITPRKLLQMRRAAGHYITEHPWRGSIALAACEVQGNHFEVTAFIPSIVM